VRKDEPEFTMGFNGDMLKVCHFMPSRGILFNFFIFQDTRCFPTFLMKNYVSGM